MDSLEPFDFKPMEKEKQVEIAGRILEQLESGDPEAVRRAVLGLGWLDSGEELLEPLLKLAAGDNPEIAATALDGIAGTGSGKAEEPLARLVLELFRRDDQSFRPVRAGAIRSLGKVGGGESSKFLAELINKPAPATLADKEAAVEALVSLADRGVDGVTKLLEQLRKDAGGGLDEAIEAACRELNLQDWEDKGFLTIEAKLEREDKADNGSGL